MAPGRRRAEPPEAESASLTVARAAYQNRAYLRIPALSDPPTEKPLPLAGLRVTDFSWIIAGPQATRILADLGAEVIRVESEAHIDSVRIGNQVDPSRPSYNGSGFFSNFNRNKLSITANLNNPRGHEVVERLIAASDVVVENFSPGVFDRLGFSWQRLQQLNPRIIYVSISGFGHSGRDSSYITWGPTAAAISGLAEMSGLPGQPPAGWGFSYLDHVAGYYAALAVLMALYHRDRGGGGQYIDIAQIETGMSLTGVQMLDFQVNGRAYERIGNHSRYPAHAPHNTYRCQDGLDGNDQWLAIAAESDGEWRALCDVLGAKGLAHDARFASAAGRLHHEAELDAALNEHTRRYDPRELMYLLQAKGVPAGAAQTTREKMELDPQLRCRGFYPSASHPELGEHRFEGLPFQMSGARWQIRHGAPCLGEHTAEILQRVLGLREDEVASLVAEAAI
jgi:crotonobetainyl-CoA:carnitine CoA-transferase CaiB-like acyl-CoA transferase